jgi:hypothetical protein
VSLVLVELFGLELQPARATRTMIAVAVAAIARALDGRVPVLWMRTADVVMISVSSPLPSKMNRISIRLPV